MPHAWFPLLVQLREHGFRYTVCQLPKKIDMQGYDLDIWVSFFVLSKVGEFFDTVLKICLMKKFLFLHWYHHLMTAWLGWLSLAYDASPGQWYAGINYTVHGPMYTYFFLSSVLSRPMFDRWCRPIAPFITTIQILQMIVYVAVNSFASYYYYYASETEGHCHIHPLNLQLNAIVTVSYLFLFSVLFFNKYVKHGKCGGDASRKAVIKRVTKRSPSPAKKRQ
jgi:elongation of very long chain fatty acids protein 6